MISVYSSSIMQSKCSTLCPSPFCNINSIFREVRVADACESHLANHEFFDVGFFRRSVLGWSPGHEVVSTIRSFEWVCPQAKSLAVWVRQDWMIGLELNELSRIQSSINSKATGNFSASFLRRWNKGFGSCSFHGGLSEA